MNEKILKLSAVVIAMVAMAAGLFGNTEPVAADGHQARVRVVHASPDGPAVDVLVDGNAAFTNVAFKVIGDYASLDAGSYNVQVVPTGATEPVVIDANLDLVGGQDYTVVAVGTLAAIEPLVLEDNNAAPAAGKAHVRFVHASPDAPAVDIAVTGGPVLFSNVAFKGVGDYLPVDAGTYDLDVKIAGTEDVVLNAPGASFEAGSVYTVFAMGLAGGEPTLQAVLSVDTSHGASTAQATGSEQDMPETLPKTGAGDYLPLMMAIAFVMIGSGFVLRRATVSQRL